MKIPNPRSQIQRSLIGTILVGLLFVVGCQMKQGRPKEKPQEAIPVKVMKVQIRQLDECIEYIGNIKGQDEAVVYPKVSGKIIEKVKEEGAVVKKGEAIAYIDRDEVGLKFEKAPVESPIDGIVGRVYIDRGVHVLPQTPVALVVNMDKVKIDLDIPERYLSRISLGQKAEIEIDAFAGEKFPGAISKISPVVEVTNRSAPIELSIDNPEHRLKSGMFARVQVIIQEHKDALVILKEAIIGKGSFVYVYTIENNKAVLRNITTGIHQGPYYEVKDGLKEGDAVVIMGQQRLYENAAVVAELYDVQGEK